MSEPRPSEAGRDAARPWVAWWGRIGLGKRIVAAVVGLVLVVNLGLALLQSVTGGADPGGPASSSFATGADGLAGWADLLARSGVAVERIERPLDEADLPTGAALVIADPASLEAGDAAAALDFAAAGGRLLLLGAAAAPLLEPVAGSPVEWRPDGPELARPLIPGAGAGVGAGSDGVAEVRAGSGRYVDPGAMLPVLGAAGEVVAASAAVGQGGTVVGVADSGIVANERLDEADNAAFALALAGDRDTVLFAEVVHGYGRATGLRTLPSSWKWAGLGLLVAALAFAWAHGQRFGPPEDRRRPLPPPRRAFVDAVAAGLARRNRPDEAVEPLRAEVRRVLRTRTGLGPAVDDRRLRDAAVAAGVDPTDVDVALGPARTAAEVVALGRAAASMRSLGGPRSTGRDR